MSDQTTSTKTAVHVEAGKLPPWDVDALVSPPSFRTRGVLSLIGPGLLLAGSAVGAGEWLFGPAVTAQYGGTLLWLATLSIVLQVFLNLEVVRYTLYCGEPVFIGFFRCWPGPRMWTIFYVTLFLAHVWPFMASNAAVPLTAAILGHLPGSGSVDFGWAVVPESQLVRAMGFVVFYACFVPLIFGGTVYRMLEAIMTAKLAILMTFLITICALLATWPNVVEIVTGFARFGSIPIRADSVVTPRYFSLADGDAADRMIIRGSIREGRFDILSTQLLRAGKTTEWSAGVPPPESLTGRWDALRRRLDELIHAGGYFLETTSQSGTLTLMGPVGSGVWQPSKVHYAPSDGAPAVTTFSELPTPIRSQADQLLANQGFVRRPIWDVWGDRQAFFSVNWAIVSAFAAIAGAGGLSNALFSNYARDKGWGMGAKTGAIPSALGGREIALSHVGRVFELTQDNLSRWKAWRWHVVKDQVGVWMACSFIGLALPCIISLELVRNAPVSGIRVAAMTAEGLSARFPDWAFVCWPVTLIVAFLALAPNAVMSGDLVARIWTDLLWIGSPRIRRMGEKRVGRVYYSILALYAVWGTIALAVFDPLQIATIGAILGNVALAFSAFHTLIVNRTLLPIPLRPSLFMQSGLAACGIFFLGITALAIVAR